MRLLWNSSNKISHGHLQFHLHLENLKIHCCAPVLPWLAANKATGEEGHFLGIVTAEKILGLKLRGTDMAVLSACETGLGDVQVGEGVYGLRRAFLQAGAKSLVMSLWKVPDKETKDLMVRFYTHLLSGQMTRVQALRQAALEMKQEKPHPYYWGAFVFLGEP